MSAATWEPRRAATARLLDYCRAEDWSGYDPFDGLNSALFQAVPFIHGRWTRLFVIQGIKRCPINLRSLLRVRKGLNPKGAALFAASLLRLSRTGLASLEDAQAMTDRLLTLRTPGWQRPCWGYNFDWQTRTYLIPRYYPNVICTTFAGEALLDAYEALGKPAYLEAAVGAGHFIVEELKRTPRGDDAFCFSYTPLRPSRVHNASLLAAGLLARLTSYANLPAFRDAARAAALYTIRHQQADGSWIYGEDANQGWIDSFHTGYNLLALRAIHRYLDLPEAGDSVKAGFAYYLHAFFLPDGIVKYYHDRTYPIDAHAVAHAILTLAEFSDEDPRHLELAGRVVDWSLQHLQSPSGWFYYQKGPRLTNRLCYMRWSQAWMLRGLAELLLANSSSTPGRPAAPEGAEARADAGPR